MLLVLGAFILVIFADSEVVEVAQVDLVGVIDELLFSQELLLHHLEPSFHLLLEIIGDIVGKPFILEHIPFKTAHSDPDEFAVCQGHSAEEPLPLVLPD